MSDIAIADLRLLREIAERGSFTAAGMALGYTQSAVSRRVASLEALAGRRLFERRRDGARLTPAASRLLAHGLVVLAELDAAERELRGVTPAPGPVRLGAFPSAMAVLVPAALRSLATGHPEVVVTVREGATPSLVRALRAGTIDVAVLAVAPPFRPLDAESPPLEAETIAERELQVAVGTGHALAGRDAVEVAELEDMRWIAGGTEAGETVLGVWPGLRERPRVVATVRDWMGKLQLVAAGLGITTIPGLMAGALPDGVQAVAVRGEPRELRRLVLVVAPGAGDGPGVPVVGDALRSVV